MSIILRDKEVGPRCVPIVADEARTFGMEGMFRQLGIYAPHGQKYKPVDRDQLMYYREDAAGQVLEEGITEAGAFSSWMAAATSYSTNDLPMLPFYIFYSMFGFQRIGDSAWQAADMRARGFLLGATAGRTTLNGEGLQHEDGHSHLLAGAIPNCRAYDPTFAGEVAVILQHGMHRMLDEQQDEYYYLTLMNENYTHPDMPEGAAEGVIKGMYLLSSTNGEAADKPPARGGGRAGKAGEGGARLRKQEIPHPPRPTARLRHHPARSRSPPPTCSTRTSASPPTSGAAPASPNCAATASTSNATTA